MNKQLQKDLIDNILKILQIPLENIEEALSDLESHIETITKYNATALNMDPIYTNRKIILDKKHQEIGISLGIKRSKTNITVQKWIFDLQQRMKGYMLTFVAAKESLMVFFENEISELEEAIINIATTMWLKQIYNIKSIDNPIVSSVSAWIYPETISGIDYRLISNWLTIIFTKNVPFNDIISSYLKIKQDFKPDDKELYSKISEWINSFIKDDDIIAPIYIRKRLIPIIDNLLELGYEQGTSAVLAKKINVHENTARNYFQEMTTNYTTIWRPIINYERLKLHNYFVKITIKDQTKYDQIYDILWNIPYLKALYIGEQDGQQILYSPSLICPHLTSEKLNERLRKLEAKGGIDYTLQLIRVRFTLGTVTSEYFNPSIKTFRDLLGENKQKIDIKKFIFSEEKRDTSMEFDDDDLPFDYNLLYFFSILKNKFLIKSRYGVIVNELQKLYEINEISISDVVAQTDFINQIEIRSRRRNLLSYALYMRYHRPRVSNVLVFEIPTPDSSTDKKIEILRNRLHVFAFQGVIVLSDRVIFIIPGISHEHPIREVIMDVIAEEELDGNYYTIKLSKAKFVPLHDLYDFDDQKWK